MAHASTSESGAPGSAYRRVLAELRSNDDGHLRYVFTYTPDAVDVRYVREDLLDADLIPQMDHHAQAARLGAVRGQGTVADEGSLEMRIDVREQVLVACFFGGDGSGLVAVSDRTEDAVAHVLGL